MPGKSEKRSRSDTWTSEGVRWCAEALAQRPQAFDKSLLWAIVLYIRVFRVPLFRRDIANAEQGKEVMVCDKNGITEQAATLWQLGMRRYLAKLPPML